MNDRHPAFDTPDHACLSPRTAMTCVAVITGSLIASVAMALSGKEGNASGDSMDRCQVAERGVAAGKTSRHAKAESFYLCPQSSALPKFS